jgi:hypothetical protein
MEKAGLPAEEIDPLREFKTPKKMPWIPAPLREAMPEVNKRITMALLLPEPPETQITIVMENSGWLSHHKKLPWEGLDPPLDTD